MNLRIAKKIRKRVEAGVKCPERLRIAAVRYLGLDPMAGDREYLLGPIEAPPVIDYVWLDRMRGLYARYPVLLPRNLIMNTIT